MTRYEENPRIGANESLKRRPLAGRVALVTGAGRGIGVGIATSLANAGADVMLVSRTQGDLDAISRQIGDLGVRAASFTADVSDEHQVEGMVEATLARLGRLDILVNNAGIVRVRPFPDHDLSAWDETFAVNTRAVFLCSRAAARAMIVAKQGGRIIMTSSHFADEAHEGYVAYCASKAAVEAISRNLALELGPHQITVNALRVGPVPSTLFSDERSRIEREAIRARLLESGHRRGGPPLGRTGVPSDVGAAVAFLASDAAAWITGASLHVDGGIHLRS
jgi:NAD(P)-dependent dehydrogenase (short-subunit alcohol dehydrogenase family)